MTAGMMVRIGDIELMTRTRIPSGYGGSGRNAYTRHVLELVLRPEAPGSIDGIFYFDHMTRMLLLRWWSGITADTCMNK